MNRLLLSYALILAALGSSSGAQSPARGDKADHESGPYRLTGTMRTVHFIVHYDPADPYLAQLMAEAATEQLARISKDLGYSPHPRRPFPLYVYPTHYGFIQAGGLLTKKFTVGTASTANEAISVDASGVFAMPEETLAHEITHAVIFRILGSRIRELPLWLNEGLAKYESQDFPDADNQLAADAAAGGLLIPLPELAERFPDQREGLAYAESGLAVRYMVKRFGASCPRVLLAELARTGSLDAAMGVAVHINAARFAADWYDYTTRRYWLLRFVRIGGAVASVLMAVLAVVAFLARRKQKRLAAQEWEREQFEEAMRKQLGNDWWR